MKAIFTFVWGVAVGAWVTSLPPVPSETNIPVVSPSGIEVRIVGDGAEAWLGEVFPVVPDMPDPL